MTDALTRESLTIAGATRSRATAVVQVLRRISDQRGAPASRRSDNGPAVVAQAVQRWLTAQQVQPVYSAPGSPWQNGYGDSFNGRVRDAGLNMEYVWHLAEAKVVIGGWQRHDTDQRPHRRRGYQTPHAFSVADEAAAGSQPDQRATFWPSRSNAILTA